MEFVNFYEKQPIPECPARYSIKFGEYCDYQLALQKYYLSNEAFARDERQNKKEEKKMRTEKIIELWYKKREKKLRDEYQLEKDKILGNDPIYSALKKHVDEIKNLLTASNFCVACVSGNSCVGGLNISNYTTDATDMLIGKVEREQDIEVDDLNNLRTEICAMLSACEDYEQEMRVLENYGVIVDDRVSN